MFFGRKNERPLVSLIISLLREQLLDKFAIKLCSIARLRVAAQLYAAAGFTLASPISAPVFADGLPRRKKGNQISLVAFVKPGGGDVTWQLTLLLKIFYAQTI